MGPSADILSTIICQFRIDSPWLVSPFKLGVPIYRFLPGDPSCTRPCLSSQRTGRARRFERGKPLHPFQILAVESLTLIMLPQQNILIDDNGSAVISDFGLSRILEESGFTPPNVCGTIRWMARELLIPDDETIVSLVTESSDVWAFGMTSIEVLFLRTPKGLPILISLLIDPHRSSAVGSYAL